VRSGVSPVTAERQGRRDAFLATSFRAVQASQAVSRPWSGCRRGRPAARWLISRRGLDVVGECRQVRGRGQVGVANRRLLGAVGDPHRGTTVDVGDPQHHGLTAAARADQHVRRVEPADRGGWSAGARQQRGTWAAVELRQQGLAVAAAAAHVQGQPRGTPRLLSGPARKFVRGYEPGGCVPSCQALGSFKYRPQAQSRASWGVPLGRPLGRTESS
jgi:hypothetical protein